MSNLLTFVISFIALLWAANHMVVGAAGLAVRMKVSPFIIGMTVIALGSSWPELMIAISSSFENKNNFAIGNAIGSNIANIGLVLGLATLIQPVTLNYSVLKRAYPLMLIVMIFLFTLLLDGFLGRLDGCLLLLCCIGMISIFVYTEHQATKSDLIIKAFKSASCSKSNLFANLVNLGLGIIILPISTSYLLKSAVVLAHWSGIGELTIGLTILSLGTTFPELFTALIAILKGEEELALGAILGSSVYNLLLILAIPGLINPEAVSPAILWRDMPVMISLVVLLIFLGFVYKNKLSRWHGGMLLVIYFSYIASLIINSF